jgi:hypothetical protein
VSGVDWQGVGRDTFNEIVDILLAREFGNRGHAVNGRGGDEGIDYDVDDSRIIFQYKYFCDGFPGNSSRRTQIKRSFKKAMTHDPEQWILVVPATVTPHERLFVTGLGKGKRVQISIRDQVWLNNQLIENRDVAEHYRFNSDIDYVYAKGEGLVSSARSLSTAREQPCHTTRPTAPSTSTRSPHSSRTPTSPTAATAQSG